METKNDDCVFTVITRDEKSFPRGIDFRKKVLNLNSPEELLGFFVSHEFLHEELSFFIERTKFVYAKITKQMITDNLLSETAILLRVVPTAAKNFSEELANKVKNNLKSLQETFDILFEIRSNQFVSSDHLYNLAMMCFASKTRDALLKRACGSKDIINIILF